MNRDTMTASEFKSHILRTLAIAAILLIPLAIDITLRVTTNKQQTVDTVPDAPAGENATTSTVWYHGR
jgi:hypothetical protein